MKKEEIKSYVINRLENVSNRQIQSKGIQKYLENQIELLEVSNLIINELNEKNIEYNDSFQKEDAIKLVEHTIVNFIK
jgi:hypothetical protein